MLLAIFRNVTSTPLLTSSSALPVCTPISNLLLCTNNSTPQQETLLFLHQRQSLKASSPLYSEEEKIFSLEDERKKSVKFRYEWPVPLLCKNVVFGMSVCVSLALWRVLIGWV